MEANKNKKKRKLTLNRVGLVLLLVIIAANFYIWKANTAGEAQIAGLNGSISAVRQQIDNVSRPADDLEIRLAKIKAELSAVQQGFPETVEHNMIIDYVLNAARDHGVEILPLLSGGWTVQNIGQSYKVLSFTATAQGSLAKVMDFISALPAGRYPTLTVSDISVRRTDAGPLSADEEVIQVTVDMRIGIYTCAPEEGSAS